MNVYQQLDVRTLINAAGDFTRFGGTLMDPRVIRAMEGAAGSFVDLLELQRRAGARIAEITRTEAAYVLPGAAAALALGTAACLTGVDRKLMRRLPNTSHFPRRQVLIQDVHCTGYERMFTLCGAVLEVVSGRRQFEAALRTRKIAAVAYVHEAMSRGLPFEDVATMARRVAVPIIVDAAGALPPFANITRYTTRGADLVAVSGGKALHGPQASGFLCGRADLIHSVLLQHQDMDVPEVLLGEAVPTHGFGRPMKTGKEEIVGLVMALELYLRRNPVRERARWLVACRVIAGGLRGLYGVRVRRVGKLPNGRPVPCVLLELDESRLGRSASDILLALKNSTPSMAVGAHMIEKGVLVINPTNLQTGEARIVVKLIRTELLRSSPAPSGFASLAPRPRAGNRSATAQ